ncbi:MAG TPA: tyrosine--tRNA ligase [Patescibacteria group bacterium]|nr:tyrosine--tRNA ligase [Patescibacteria group bacterium]
MKKDTHNDTTFIDTILLKRGIEAIYPSKEALREVLLAGRKLTMYVGIDPTATVIHVGNAIGLRKLAQFQKLGHKIIFLVGDFTARLGDPSDKEQMRRMLTEEEIKRNVKTYKEQASRILDFDSKVNPAVVKFNSTWLNKLSFGDIIELASHFTVQQMMERDLFQKRLKEEKPIGLHEFLYPLMQGYDSVAMNVDLELGGTDQTFNMLAGRTLMKDIHKKEKFVITTPLLLGLDGRKMSKSFGNFIALTASPEDKFGKTMSMTDSLVPQYLDLATDLTQKEIDALLDQMKSDPMNVKKRLAFEIVSLFDGKDAAQKAQGQFEKVFQHKELPTEVPTYLVSEKTLSLMELLLRLRVVSSKSVAKRLVKQGGVEIDGKRVTDPSVEIDIHEGMIVRCGKKEFRKIVTRV